jgi:hypothetical protein
VVKIAKTQVQTTNLGHPAAADISMTQERKQSPSSIPKLRRGRVFIIGAGVSASCGIAVANRIFRESLIRLQSRNLAATTRIHGLLDYLYPNFDLNVRLRNYPNIEDFLNLLEMAKKFNTEEFIASSLWSKEDLEEVKQTTLRAVTDYIWSVMGEEQKQSVIQTFVHKHMAPGDTIITFNWDLTIERALEAYPGDPGFLYTYSRQRKEKQFSLLKPHGSVDWFDKKAVRGLPCERKIEALDTTLCYYPRFNFAGNPELARIAPVIVPPVADKKFRYEFLKRTWRFVYRAVSDATELHVLGYSLPREDQFARLVFRRAIRTNILYAKKHNRKGPRVLVVNPDQNVEGTISRLVGRDVTSFDFHQAYFEDYVASLEE